MVSLTSPALSLTVFNIISSKKKYIFILQLNLPLKIIKTSSEILKPSGFQVNMHLDFEFTGEHWSKQSFGFMLNWRNPECVSPLTKESASHLNGRSRHGGLSVGLWWHRCNNYGLYVDKHQLSTSHNFARNWCLWPPENPSLHSDLGDKESVRRLNLSIKPSRLAELQLNWLEGWSPCLVSFLKLFC